METKTYKFIDKTDWVHGEWDNEADKVQFLDDATGLPCLIKRNLLGAWCGYVGVAPGHPLHGVYFDDMPIDLSVHGGLTYSDACMDEAGEHGICHVAGPGEPEHVWWFGFDCAHGGDFIPAYERLMRKYRDEIGGYVIHDVYRNQAYVTEQTRLLAAQLASGDVRVIHENSASAQG